jgi:hypothetical protein
MNSYFIEVQRGTIKTVARIEVDEPDDDVVIAEFRRTRQGQFLLAAGWEVVRVWSADFTEVEAA